MINVEQIVDPTDKKAKIIFFLALLGLATFIAIAYTAPFQEKKLQALYPKPQEYAAEPVKATLESLTNALTAEAKKGSTPTLTDIATKRKRLYIKTAETNPSEAIRFSQAKTTRDSFPSGIKSFVEEEKEITASLSTMIEEGDGEFPAKKRLLINDPATNKTYALFFTSPPDKGLTKGTVRVKGFALDSIFIVNSLTSISASETTERRGMRIESTSGSQTENHRILAVMVEPTLASPPPEIAYLWPPDTRSRVNVTTNDVRNILFEASDSTRNFYLENSYGKVTFSGDVVGPYTLTQGILVDDYCNVNGWAREMDTTLANNGINVNNYQHVVYVFPGKPSTICSLGYARLGGSQVWIFAPLNKKVYVHELGHNFDLPEASGLDCNGYYTESLGYYQWQFGSYQSCEEVAYADPTSIMGKLVRSNASGGLEDVPELIHFNAVEKAALGWITSDQIQEVTESDTYRITSLNKAGGGTKVLKIKATYKTNLTADKTEDASTYIYVSYRKPPPGLSFDRNLPETFTSGLSIYLGYRGFTQGYAHQTVVSSLIDSRPHSLGRRGPMRQVGGEWSRPTDNYFDVSDAGFDLTNDFKNGVIMIQARALSEASADVYVYIGPFPQRCSNCRSDTNQDHVVNILDFSQYRSCYGKAVTDQVNGKTCRWSDANVDGKIDRSDLTCIQAYFGTTWTGTCLGG